MPQTAQEIVARLAPLVEQRLFDQLLALYHPEALFVTVARGAEPAGPEETVDSIRRACADEMYHSSVTEVVAVDDHAAFVQGSMRVRAADGRGHHLASRTWLFTVKEGLVYRGLAVEGADDARALYRRHGIGLGF